jgi:predicted lipoprotein with Yx(FWY)xxD motif
VKHTSSRTVLGLASVVLLGLATACGGDDDDSSSASTVAATAAPAATSATPTTAAASGTTQGDSLYPSAGTGTTVAATPAGASEVKVADSSLGPILVDSKGMTLYMFVPDAQGPSTCTGGCLAAWPSLTGPATAGDGADAAMLGTATRPDDGSAQVTYNGWPLYYFAQDAAPGDVNGQDSNEKWYVVDATGTPVGME